MNIFDYFELLFTDYTLRTITLGTATLGAISGMLGSFAVLRKESLLGDAISHAALPGIAIAFLITQAKDNNVLLIGALISGILGAIWISGIVKRTILKTDAALGIVMSVFFGFGMLLLTYIQRQPNANQAGLDKYLFGQAATLMQKDVVVLVSVMGASLLVLALFWKEIKVLLFDSDYAKSIGINTRFLDFLILVFIVISIVLGLQTVGVILMSAMLLAPAAAARQWTNKLSVMLLLAALFGISSGVLGTAISATTSNLSTGPVIVLIAIAWVMFSFLFAPHRGLIHKQYLHFKNRRELGQQKTLIFMYNIAKEHENIFHPHPDRILNNFLGFSGKTLEKMEKMGWIQVQDKMWNLTTKGFEQAQKLSDFNKERE